jgi:hypothetical protein
MNTTSNVKQKPFTFFQQQNGGLMLLLLFLTFFFFAGYCRRFPSLETGTKIVLGKFAVVPVMLRTRKMVSKLQRRIGKSCICILLHTTISLLLLGWLLQPLGLLVLVYNLFAHFYFLVIFVFFSCNIFEDQAPIFEKSSVSSLQFY